MTNQSLINNIRANIQAGLYDWTNHLRAFDKNDKGALVGMIKDRFVLNNTAYGLASERDFGDYAVIFANLFAHNNKQYFIYKAISDSNKVGYLSRRQHYLMLLSIAKWNKEGIGSSTRESRLMNFLAKNGTMASPYKLLKRAFKENPRAKFLSRFFPLGADKKTTLNENILIELCDMLMRNKTNITIAPAPIDECYKVKLTDDYSGSGQRYTTSSCMYNYPVGKFYEAFGAEGRIVYERGKPIGRFLLWKLPDGKEYVDRLYVQGHGYQDALEEIDKQYPNALKYPHLLSHNTDDCYMLELKKPELVNGENKPYTPYLDTFSYLMRKDGKYFLSNSEYGTGKYVYQLHDVHNGKHFCSCPHCKQMYWQGDTEMDAGKKEHQLVCSAYEPRTKKLKEMIAIYRQYIQGGESVSRTALFEV